jgi:hypothetical protein
MIMNSWVVMPVFFTTKWYEVPAVKVEIEEVIVYSFSVICTV